MRSRDAMDVHEAPGVARLAAPPWWAWPLLVPGPLLAWHVAIADELARVPDAPAWFASPALAWGGVIALAFGLAFETLFYGMLWGAKGVRLPFAPCALTLLQLSTLEAFAGSLLRLPPDGAPGPVAMLALVGARATWSSSGPGGFGSAFGSLGVLTIVRMALWAWVQSEAVGRRWREAAAMVALVWLVSHVAQGMLMELMRGRSVGS